MRSRHTSNEILASLRRGSYNNFPNPTNETRCPICLDDYTENDNVLAMHPCAHFFHADCLQQWLQTSQSCPNCRARVQMRPQSASGNASGPNPSSVPASAAPTSGTALGPRLDARIRIARGLFDGPVVSESTRAHSSAAADSFLARQTSNTLRSNPRNTAPTSPPQPPPQSMSSASPFASVTTLETEFTRFGPIHHASQTSSPAGSLFHAPSTASDSASLPPALSIQTPYTLPDGSVIHNQFAELSSSSMVPVAGRHLGLESVPPTFALQDSYALPDAGSFFAHFAMSGPPSSEPVTGTGAQQRRDSGSHSEDMDEDPQEARRGRQP